MLSTCKIKVRSPHRYKIFQAQTQNISQEGAIIIMKKEKTIFLLTVVE